MLGSAVWARAGIATNSAAPANSAALRFVVLASPGHAILPRNASSPER